MSAKSFHRSEFQLLFAALLLLAVRSVASADESAGATKTLQPFLAAYCTSCHGAEQQKGDRQFDTLAVEISDDDVLVDYQDILDQLNLGEMPPKESPQPSTDQRRAVIGWLTTTIDRYHQSRQETDHQTILRRLNSREYQNTIRDLLHLNMAMFQPAASFPRDQTEEHLDNMGEALVTSSHLLTGYLDAAEQIIDKALWPLEKPAVQTWAFRDGFHQQPEIDQVHRKTNRFEHMTLYDVVGADKPEGAYGPIHAFAGGVPHDGIYELRVKAEAVNRLHPYDDNFLGTDRNEPFRLGIVAGNREVGSLHLTQPIEPLLAEIDLADEPKWYTVRVWLDQGYTPRFTFRNGLMDARNLWSRLINKYPDQFPKGLKGIVEMRFNAIKHGKLPQIRIHEIEIEGPFYDQWPRPSQLALLGENWQQATSGGELSVDQTRDVVRSFASRAYRRPATDSEVDSGHASHYDASSRGTRAACCVG